MKLKINREVLRKVVPYVKEAVVVAGEVNEALPYKHKVKVDKALNQSYTALSVVEKLL